MSEILFIDAVKSGYEPSQVYETMTVGELADAFAGIAERHGEDMKVYLRHDGGYTYGGITAYDIEVAEIEDDEDDCWEGEGWYRIAFSDGGQDWTNDGPIWVESESQLEDEMEAARCRETDTHIPYSEYMGSGDEPQEQE